MLNLSKQLTNSYHNDASTQAHCCSHPLTSLTQLPQEKGANVVLHMLQELLSRNDTTFLTDNKLFWVAVNSLLH